MHILITGGTGFIGSALCPLLLREGHELTVLTRHPGKVAKQYDGQVRAIRSLTEFRSDWPLDAVINLAGEGMADRPWTAARKHQLHTSRITVTEELTSILRRRTQRPEVVISGSGIGWYGDQGDRILEESATFHDGFMHRLCADWEHAAQDIRPLGVRVCLLRTGVVIGHSGGLMKRLLPVFGLGLGGRIGSGTQWISWIALSDYLGIIRFLLNDTQQSGIFNATAPKPVSNVEFTAILAQALGRPAFLHIPASVLKLAMGEMSDLLLHSQRAVPSRLLDARFKFRSGSLEQALRNELA
jgi:uncharacterized protein (TIGR01777 family)